MQAAAASALEFEKWQKASQAKAYWGVASGFRELVIAWCALRNAREKDISVRETIYQNIVDAHLKFNSAVARTQLYAETTLPSLDELRKKAMDFDESAEEMDFREGNTWTAEQDKEFERRQRAAETAAKAFIEKAREQLAERPAPV